MKLAIFIILGLGLLIAVISFTLDPFHKRTGLLTIALGVIAGLTLRIAIGLSVVGIGILILVIQTLYHYYC